jgi:DNA-binding NarL/FixJ family response regulator
MSPRVLVVDDHPIVRQALSSLLERDGLDVVGEAWDGAEAHRLARELCADVVVLGFTRPLVSCLSVAGEILRTVPRTGVILVAFEDYLVVRAFRAGIRGYVLRTRVVEDLPLAIRAVAHGSTYVSPGIPSAIVEACLTATHDLPSGA